MIWDNIKKIIEENNSFIITTHVNSDGDGLGAQLALHHLLRIQGKQSRIINPTPVADNYSFLFEKDEWELCDREKHLSAFQEVDYLFVLDVGVWERIGDVGTLAKEANLPIACIDHHPYVESFGKDTVIIDSASSTGELIFDLIKSSGVVLSHPMALGIYTSLVNDTGNFRFSNSTDKVHFIAGELLQYGIKPDEIYSLMTEFHSINKMKFIGEVLSGLDFRRDGELVVAKVTREIMDRHKIEDWELDGLVDYPRAIKKSRVVILAYEKSDGSCKLSMRAKDKRVNMNIIARKHGGGGHRYASGISTQEPLATFLPPILDEVESQLVETLNGEIKDEKSESPEDYFNTLTTLCKEIIFLEYEASHFYLLLMGKLKFDQEEMKTIIATLYKTEEEHLEAARDIFNQLLNWGTIRFDIDTYISELKPDMTCLTQFPKLEEMIKNNDLQGIHEVSRSIEGKAIDRYRGMIKEYENYSKNHNYLTSFLAAIIREEEKHIEELDALFLGK